jgi:glycosyltransferase involved in cell wall biosynthesis
MKNLIIIPAYNEEQALPGTIASLQRLPTGYELVVVNDGSRDGTAAAALESAKASRLPVHLINLPLNGGIGVAVQAGYLFALKRGDFTYAIQFDADGQHDASYIEALVAECEARELDLCIGSRFLQKSGDNFQSTITRRVGIRYFSRLIGVLSGVRVTDPTSGFRCAGPRVWKRFAARYPDDYPEPESLFWCARNKLAVGEIPVRMHERQGGVTSIRYFKTIYYMVKVSLAILVDRLRSRERL